MWQPPSYPCPYLMISTYYQYAVGTSHNLIALLAACNVHIYISSLSHSKADMLASVLLQLSAIWSLPMLATHPLFAAITATSASPGLFLRCFLLAMQALSARFRVSIVTVIANVGLHSPPQLPSVPTLL